MPMLKKWGKSLLTRRPVNTPIEEPVNTPIEKPVGVPIEKPNVKLTKEQLIEEINKLDFTLLLAASAKNALSIYDINLEEKNFEFNGSIVAFIDIMRP